MIVGCYGCFRFADIRICRSTKPSPTLIQKYPQLLLRNIGENGVYWCRSDNAVCRLGNSHRRLCRSDSMRGIHYLLESCGLDVGSAAHHRTVAQVQTRSGTKTGTGTKRRRSYRIRLFGGRSYCRTRRDWDSAAGRTVFRLQVPLDRVSRSFQTATME